MDQEDIMRKNSSILDSITSSTRSSAGREDVFPTLERVARYLVNLHSPNVNEDVVDTLASGTILCDIVSDYIGSEFIDFYNTDAKRDSEQARENFQHFCVACKNMQIPRSCVATSKDFEEKNYRKIELTLVLFVMRGFAYSLPPDASIMEVLKNYELADFPELSNKDRRVCENIIDVFRNKGNNKDISVNTDSSDSEKPERKNGVIDEVNFDENEDKQEEEPLSAAANHSDVDSVDEHLPGEKPKEKPKEEPKEEAARPSEVVDEKEEKADEEDAVDEHLPAEKPVEEEAARPSEVVNEPAPVAPVVPVAPAEPDDESVDEHLPAEPAESDDAVDEHVPVAPAEPAESDDAVDEHLPAEPDDAVDEHVPVAPAESDDDAVDEHLPAEPAEPDDAVDEHVNTLTIGELPTEVEDDLQSPRELFPDEPEIITQSNLPPGWDIDPRADPLPEEPEEPEEPAQPAQPVQAAQPAQAVQAAQPAQQVAKPKKAAKPVAQTERKMELKSMEEMKNKTKVSKRPIHWYVVMILILLMIVCLVGIVVSGVWLAKINQ